MSAYDVGAVLELELLASTDLGSPTLSSVRLRCEVVHAYTPFTLSVVVRARLLDDSPLLPAGTEVILKILDRKHVDSQGRRRRGHEWTEQREHLARERWQAIAAGSLQDDFDKDADFEDWEEAWIEERYHRSIVKWYSTECKAYSRLSDLQGKHIPRLYHTFRAPDSSPGQSIPLDGDHRARGLMLEYLQDAVTAADIPDPTIYPLLREHTRSLMSAMSSFRQHGVVHLDLRSENLLVAQHRAMIIDFGHAMFPRADQSNEEWDKYALSKNKVETTRSILHYRGLRARSPVPLDDTGYYHQNRFIHAQSTEWIDRWYISVHDSDTREELIKQPYSQEAPWFIKKDGIEAWVATKEESYEGFQRPRPGSPDWQGLSP